jgi:hypothetical protein
MQCPKCGSTELHVTAVNKTWSGPDRPDFPSDDGRLCPNGHLSWLNPKTGELLFSRDYNEEAED